METKKQTTDTRDRRTTNKVGHVQVGTLVNKPDS
jgi:hypothetical protein